MAIKSYKPTTPGQRGMTSQDMGSITSKKPVRSLLIAKKRTSGRNSQGRITVRHRGGGAKRFYRLVSFDLPHGTKAKVEHIEYDPNRSARLARLKLEDGTYRYVLAARGLKQGSKVIADEEVPVETGNRTSLANIPVGTAIHAVELQPGKGAQLARSAGTGAQLIAKEGDWAQVKLPSGEVRIVSVKAKASIGQIGNDQHQNIKTGKAGRNRNRGRRPSVRGIAMNAADHPHGGGEGRGKGGNHPQTPWGQSTLGFKTRRRKNTNKFIVKRRPAKRRK